MKINYKKEVIEALTILRDKQPLILNLTNYVSMEFVANGLLSLGASPIMSLAIEELEELISVAQSVVINIGTLDQHFIALVYKAAQLANQKGVPVILDPVGAGASALRLTTTLDLIHQAKIEIIRGNASEISRCVQDQISGKGVDSLIESKAALPYAETLAQKTNAIVVVSGPTDYIVSQQATASIERGSAMLTKVTGAGCLLTAIIAAFRAVVLDPFKAAQLATWFYAVQAEKAATFSALPGDFKVNLINQLNTMPE